MGIIEHMTTTARLSPAGRRTGRLAGPLLIRDATDGWLTEDTMATVGQTVAVAIGQYRQAAADLGRGPGRG